MEGGKGKRGEKGREERRGCPEIIHLPQLANPSGKVTVSIALYCLLKA